MHVPSTCNVHHVIFIHSVVMPLPRCANAPSLVSPAQKFTNSEDPIFKISPSLARAACAAYHWLPQRILSPYGGHQPTKFESDPSTGWPAALKNKKEVQIPCTCPARAMCIPGQISIQRRDGYVEMGQCSKFGVASSKIHKLGGSHV